VPNPRISFIVPVRNDASRLQICLQSILASHSIAGEIEILVVDNGSTDDSPSVARALGARVLVIENVRVSELRNRGAEQAHGELLAFVDADNQIAPGWVAAALVNLGAADVGATGALYQSPPAGTWVQRAYGVMRGQTRRLGDVEWLGSGNLAVRRNVFQAVGGFDTTLEACEDVDLCHRVQGAGFRILGDPRLGSVHHGDPKTLAAVFFSELWRGRDNLRVTFRRPIIWSSVPSALIPVLDALLLPAGLIALLAWLRGWAPGLPLAVLSVALLSFISFGRVARSAARTPNVSATAMLQSLAVTCVFDVARALALFTRAPHRSARPRTAVAAS
jgi:GT2 family glycosyltransferase